MGLLVFLGQLGDGGTLGDGLAVGSGKVFFEGVVALGQVNTAIVATDAHAAVNLMVGEFLFQPFIFLAIP